ncbi:thioredoxin family protein [Chroococcidiopsis sp. FACHB-1243]|uniref:TlpA family protein disulfide reductase n=1 Tax=Chroococcidiopsis sp. [FACHB-1243] TaxID=2692781 RepID=UPI0017849F5D|nr:thioredoxin family protein [Chroococcidiopsis sp. [FACHB-1243]]MBD2308360.1 thioredoxin family protein [Chroococcidiopsis sp. [FACHB-1243]]
MKTHRRSIALLSLGLGSLAAVLGLTTFSGNSLPTAQLLPAVASAPEPNPLAQQLQGKPTVVKIYADWCPACQRLQPITNSLQQEFNGKANFVVFDVTDRATSQAATEKARQLGLSDFLAAHRAQTSTVSIINPSNGQVLTQFRYNFDRQDYVDGIERAVERLTASK